MRHSKEAQTLLANLKSVIPTPRCGAMCRSSNSIAAWTIPALAVLACLAPPFTSRSSAAQDAAAERAARREEVLRVERAVQERFEAERIRALEAIRAQQAQNQAAREVIVQAAPVMSEDNFNQLLFRNQGNPEAARKRLEVVLALRADAVDRVCSLSDVQKKKLKLAGRGDIKRFFDQIEDLR